MTSGGSAPHQIVTTLREKGVLIKAKDVYNARMQIRATNLGSRTPTEAMIQELQRSSFIHTYKLDSEDRITHIFFPHPHSLQLIQKYPYILLLDCTYKTNHYKLPLLNIVGVSNVGTTFNVALCFIKQEAEGDFLWALEQLKNLVMRSENSFSKVMVTDRDLALISAIRVVFPSTYSILCIWHIDQCVKAKTRKTFNQEEDKEKEKFLKA
jgi:hypothetical protein